MTAFRLDIIDIDWLKRYNSDDMYWLPYGLTGEEATDEYFDSLLSKDVDDLTSEEIRHLLGYLRVAGTIEKLQNEVFIHLQEKYFDSQDEMLSFASNWVDLSEYGIQLPDDIAYLDALYDQIESGVLCYDYSGLPLEMAVIGIIEELPSWAQDPSCVLSKNQTLRLIREANMEWRRNLRKWACCDIFNAPLSSMSGAFSRFAGYMQNKNR